MKNYKKSTAIKIPSQKLELDLRSETSIRVRNYIDTGDVVEVKGKGAVRQHVKATWF